MRYLHGRGFPRPVVSQEARDLAQHRDEWVGYKATAVKIRI